MTSNDAKARNLSDLDSVFMWRLGLAEKAVEPKRAELFKIAATKYPKASIEYLTLGGPLSDELATHLPKPANDDWREANARAVAGMPKQVPTRNLDLVTGMTEAAPPRIAAAAAAKKQAEAEAAKENAAAATQAKSQRVKPQKKWLDPEVKAARVTGKQLTDAIATYNKDVTLANEWAASIGASQHAGKITDAEAEALIALLVKKTGISKATIKKHVAKGKPKINPEFTEHEEEQERLRLAASNAEAGYDFLPRNYFFNAEEGIFEQKVVYGKDIKFEPICRVFNVVGLTLNQESSAWGLVISFTDKAGKAKEIICYDSEAKEDARGLSARLTGENLKVYCSNEEFSRFLLLVGDNVTRQIITFDKPGWHEVGDDKSLIFVTPTGEVIGADENENREYRLKRGVGFELDTPPGDLETWKRVNAAMAKENPHWAVGPALGLVGAVIQAAKLDTCGINLSGHSSYGKTTAQRQAATCWTQTEDKKKPGLLRPANTTVSAIENLAEAANGTALLLDELENVDDKRKLGPMIMGITGGQGRARQDRRGGLRRVSTWATFFVMSCEDPARKFIEENGGKWKPGHSARLMDFNCNEGKKLDTETVQAWRSELDANAGHAGPAFIRRALEAGAFDDGDALQARVVAAAAKIAGETGKANPVLGRAAIIYGAIAVTAEIMDEVDVITAEHAALIPGALQSFWVLFGESNDAAASDPRAEAVENLITQLNARRGVDVLPVEPPTDRDGNERQRHRDAVAWYDETKSVIYVRKDKLEALTQAKISGTAVAKHLEGEGVLIRSDEDDRLYWRNTPNNGRTPSYRLKSDKLGFAGDDGDATPGAVKRGDPGSLG